MSGCRRRTWEPQPWSSQHDKLMMVPHKSTVAIWQKKNVLCFDSGHENDLNTARHAFGLLGPDYIPSTMVYSIQLRKNSPKN